MSIIKFTVPTLGGVLSKATGDAGELNVGKGVKEKVVMTGYLGAAREKGEDGKFHDSKVFGRLSVRAAITGEGAGKRYVLSIDGGLRGVLFPTKDKKSDKSPDYTGNIDLEDGNILPLFGRKKSSEAGDFISLETLPAEPKKDNGKGKGGKAAAPAPSFEDDGDIPF